MKIIRNTYQYILAIILVMKIFSSKNLDISKKSAIIEVNPKHSCYIKEASQRICENFGRKLTFIMFEDFVKNKIPERALINQGVDFYLRYYNYNQIKNLINEAIGPENENEIKIIRNEYNRLRNKQNLKKMISLAKSKSREKDSMDRIFKDFYKNEDSLIRNIQLLRYLAVKYMNNHMKLQISSLIQNNKLLRVKNIRNTCRGKNKILYSCVRKASIIPK